MNSKNKEQVHVERLASHKILLIAVSSEPVRFLDLYFYDISVQFSSFDPSFNFVPVVIYFNGYDWSAATAVFISIEVVLAFMYFFLQRCMFCFVGGAQHIHTQAQNTNCVLCCHSCFATTGHWRRSYGGDLTELLFRSNHSFYTILWREMCWDVFSVAYECSLRHYRSKRMKIDCRVHVRVRVYELCERNLEYPESGRNWLWNEFYSSSPLWVNMCVRCSHCSNEKFGRKISDYRRNKRKHAEIWPNVKWALNKWINIELAAMHVKSSHLSIHTDMHIVHIRF